MIISIDKERYFMILSESKSHKLKKKVGCIPWAFSCKMPLPTTGGRQELSSGIVVSGKK